MSIQKSYDETKKLSKATAESSLIVFEPIRKQFEYRIKIASNIAEKNSGRKKEIYQKLADDMQAMRDEYIKVIKDCFNNLKETVTNEHE